VVATQAGNGHIGWIPLSATGLARINWQLKVSLSARRLTVLQGGKVINRFTVAIGAPAAPTPTGRFAVTDRLTTGDPAGPYGCCILALSAKSPHAIQGWNGGNRIAIHSTPEVSSIGEAASHGCLRVTLADGRWLLDHVPLGTPALISS
jgi:lipoprotein-anchoring transpeptidase ErfK/SrfK